MLSLPLSSEKRLPSEQSYQHHAPNNVNVHAGTQCCDLGTMYLAMDA